MVPISKSISGRFYEFLSQENRVENLLERLQSDISTSDSLLTPLLKQRNLSNPKLLVLLRIAIIRIQEHQTSFKETETQWLQEPLLQGFTGFKMRQSAFPVSMVDIDNFWQDLQSLQIVENAITMDGISFVRRYLELAHYFEAKPEPAAAYNTHCDKPVGFIDRFLNEEENHKINWY